MRRIFILALCAISIPVATVQAQYGAGLYYPRGPYLGFWTGPAFGYVPGAYQGFWSNGFTLYGPPVPTYGSIPGFYGGYDQRLSNFPDLRYGYFGPWGWRGGYVPLDQPPNCAVVPSIGLALCEVHLPAADAELFVNGVKAEALGPIRTVRVNLPPNTGVSHELEVRWATQSSIGASKRTVIMRAGETVVVDFTKRDDG
jgi:uncharacterized protein (TIGR03000 family)